MATNLGQTLLIPAKGGASAAALVTPQSLSPYLGYAPRLETPVADGTALSQLTDQSGNGRHATQGTGANQSLFKTGANGINGLPVYRSDGSNDGYATAALDLSAASAISIVSIVKPTASAAVRNLCELSADYTAITDGFAVYNETNQAPAVILRGNSATPSGVHDTVWTGAAHLFAAVMDKAQFGFETAPYLDGMLSTNAFGTTAANNTNTFAAAQPLYLFSRNGGASRAWLGDVGDFWMWDRALTQQELSDLGAFFFSLYATAYGVYYPANANTLIDNVMSAVHWTAYHRLAFETNAPRVHWHATTDLFSSSLGTRAETTLMVDNNPWLVGNFDTDQQQLFAAKGISGTRDLEVTAGLTAWPSSPAAVKGVDVLGVTLPSTATTTRVTASPAPLWVVYGDSISVGDTASICSVTAWSLMLRREVSRVLGGSVRVEGWGSRSLWDDAQDSTVRAALVARLTAGSPTKIFITIGTNDYGLNKQTAANFGTALGLVIDDCRAILPTVEFILVSPIGRAAEGANALGSTMANYRTQYANVAAAKSAYCLHVDGSTLLSWIAGETAEYNGDGIHPNDRGFVTLFGRLMRAIGFDRWADTALTVMARAKTFGDAVVTVADNTATARINDLAGRKNHALQATGGAQPRYFKGVTPAFGPALRFDGGDGLATAAIDLTAASGLTVYLVSKHASGDTGVLMELTADYSAVTTGFQIKHDAGNTITAALIGDVGASDFTTTGTVIGTHTLITVVFDKSLASDEVTVYLNGALAGTRANNSNNTNTFANAALNIAARNNAASGHIANTGEVADAWLYNVAHGTSARQAIEQSLCTEHGLTWAG